MASRRPTKRPNDDFTADQGPLLHPRRRSTIVAPHHLRVFFLQLIYGPREPQAESKGALGASFPASNVINRVVVVCAIRTRCMRVDFLIPACAPFSACFTPI